MRAQNFVWSHGDIGTFSEWKEHRYLNLGHVKLKFVNILTKLNS
jgi:hypothetical protein